MLPRMGVGHHHDHGHRHERGHDHGHDHKHHHGHGHGHEHGHGHTHSGFFVVHRPGELSGEIPEHRPKEKRRLKIAIAVTTTAMVVEVIGGVITGSLALISDAGHMLTHSFALVVSVLAMYLAARPTKKERAFGLYRTEVLAALFNAVTLVVITGFIAVEAWERLMAPQPILAWQMFGVAVFGLIVNVATALILMGAGHGDINFRSAFLHMVGDTMSSVVIVIGAVVIRYTGWVWIDPVLSVMICGVILYWAYGLTRDSVGILMETAPKGLAVEAVEHGIKERFPDIAKVTDVHIWVITSGLNAMTACLAVPADMDLAAQKALSHEVRHFVLDEFDIGHAVFEYVGTKPL
ncbi:cation diffusion facilitator family transporter [bacterium]|nr:cation diffusion facilitator family transporter [bacterium]